MDKVNAIENTKNFLGLNDASVDAKLYLNGNEYAIDAFDIQFQQSVDFKGEPQREVKGGLLSMTFNQTSDEQLNYWMFHKDIRYSGSVVFSSFSRLASPIITIYFENGCCAKYSKNIGNSSISFNIIISAQKISINGIDHKNNPKYNG
jgi:hypothetical protein